MGVTRLVSLADAAPLAALVRANREFLAPWFPAREDAYLTVEGQRKVLESACTGFRRRRSGFRRRRYCTTPRRSGCSPATASGRSRWAPSYLKIAGEWQDHILYHLLNEDV
jgi:hypothetical protein